MEEKLTIQNTKENLASAEDSLAQCCNLLIVAREMNHRQAKRGALNLALLIFTIVLFAKEKFGWGVLLLLIGMPSLLFLFSGWEGVTIFICIVIGFVIFGSLIDSQSSPKQPEEKA